MKLLPIRAPWTLLLLLRRLVLVLLPVLQGVYCSSSKRLGSTSSISGVLRVGCRVLEGASPPFAGLQTCTLGPFCFCAATPRLLCIPASPPLLLLLLVVLVVLTLLLQLLEACSSTVHLHVLLVLLPSPSILVSRIHESCLSTHLLLLLLVMLLLPALLLITCLQLLLSGHTQWRRLQQQQPGCTLRAQCIPISMNTTIVLPMFTPLVLLVLPV